MVLNLLELATRQDNLRQSCLNPPEEFENGIVLLSFGERGDDGEEDHCGGNGRGEDGHNLREVGHVYLSPFG